MNSSCLVRSVKDQLNFLPQKCIGVCVGLWLQEAGRFALAWEIQGSADLAADCKLPSHPALANLVVGACWRMSVLHTANICKLQTIKNKKQLVELQ